MSLPPPPSPAPESGPTMSCRRHPDRPAGRRCTRCGRPACSDCLVQAAVGSQCRECAKAARPPAGVRVRRWTAARPALATTVLIAVNLAVFVYVTVRSPSALSGRGITLGHAQLGLTRAALGDGFAVRLADGGVYVGDGGEWWRLVTAGFLHFGLLHLLFNMYLLYVLGNMLEPSLGTTKFVLVYFAGMLGGSAGSVMLGEGLAGGASGAVFGLMSLAVVGYWMHGANPLNTSIGGLFVLNLFVTFLFPGISVGGHVGGAVGGAVCALAVMAPAWRRVPSWASYATPVAVAAVAVAAAVAVSAS